jgi:hypothetical protein
MTVRFPERADPRLLDDRGKIRRQEKGFARLKIGALRRGKTRTCSATSLIARSKQERVGRLRSISARRTRNQTRPAALGAL